VIHDDVLERTTTMSGRVAAWAWNALRDARLRREDGSPTDDPLPKLEEILPPAGSSRRLLVEIKPGVSDRVIQQVMSLAHRHIEVQSFDLRIVHRAQQFRPDILAHWLIEDARLVGQSADGPWHGVNLAHQLIEGALVSRLHNVGKTVGAWTVNELPDIQRILELGIDMMITDEPERVRDATDRLKSST
jgi:glycerophosphoryl diester phosphodiesterase